MRQAIRLLRAYLPLAATAAQILLLGQFLLLGSLRPAHATPDPLGERRKPTLNPKAPAPPPSTRTGGAKEPAAKTSERSDETAAGEEPDTPRAKVAVTSSTRATEVPVRTEASAVRSDAGGAARAAGKEGAAGAALTLGSADGSYLLGPKDLLRVEIWNRAEAEYEWRPVIVGDDGTVNLPLLDNVGVGGLTVVQAIQKLTGLYDQFIIQPQVFIQILEYNSRQVSVVGEVKNPGRYALKGDMNVTELLAQAGDMTKFASKIVRVIRETGVEGQSEVIDVDISAINAGDPSRNIKVRPDDTIYVLTNKNIIYVSGMVKSEGYVDWEEGMTAQQTVILAGGWQEGAAPGRAKVVRTENGKAREFKVNLKDNKKPFPVLPGDIIKIPKSIL